MERYGLLQFVIDRRNPSIGDPLEWLQLQSLRPNIVGMQTTHDSRGLHVRMRPVFEKLDRQRNISYSTFLKTFITSRAILILIKGYVEKNALRKILQNTAM